MWNDTVIEAMRMSPVGTWDGRQLGLPQVELSNPESRVLGYQSLLQQLKHRDPVERLALSDEIGRRAGLPTRAALMMTRQQLLELHGLGMEIGAHTITHPILARIDDASARDEIAGGREQLAQWLGAAPTVFAYPNGVPERDYGERDIRMVRQAGFSAAAATARGSNGLGADVLQLRRFTPWDRATLPFALRCAHNLRPRAQAPVLPRPGPAAW